MDCYPADCDFFLFDRWRCINALKAMKLQVNYTGKLRAILTMGIDQQRLHFTRYLFQKQVGLLYSDSPNMDARVRPPAEYRQDGDDEDDDDEFDDDLNDGSTLSNNVPSWV